MHWLDPDFLPLIEGTVQRFVLNPKGDVDGVVLSNGTEIHTAPHLSEDVIEHVAIGEAIGIRGVRPRNADVIVAVAIDSPNGHRIEDRGPDEEHKHFTDVWETRDEDATVHGTVARILHGPKGDPHGALLTDGTIIRFPPHAAEAFRPALVVGKKIVAKGIKSTMALGSVLDAHAVGATTRTLRERPSAPRKHAPKKHAAKKQAPKKHAVMKHAPKSHDNHLMQIVCLSS